MSDRPTGLVNNPGGRPRDTPEMKQAKAASKAATPDMVRILVEIASDPEAPPAARVLAADKVLDRAFGKPAQAVALEIEHKGDTATPELVRHELARLLTQLAPKRVPIEAEAVVVQALPSPKDPQP